MAARRPLRVFISYAHADDGLRERLRAHLSVLQRDGLVSAWDDREVEAGDAWADVIDARLNEADLVVLLVSPDFMNSDYCYGKEMHRALERHDDPADRAIVVPVILRACDWEGAPFGRLQALPPRGARPLTAWKTEDDYFTAVTKGLRRRIEHAVDASLPWHERVATRLRDPLWWQRPRVLAVAASVVIAAGAMAWWWSAATSQVAVQIEVARLAMRSGRYLDAQRELQPACASRFVGARACLALRKAELGAQLERAEIEVEPFSAQVQALRQQAPDDPDLLLFGAQVALKEGGVKRQAEAFADIRRAIALAGGDFPEAHFYLANLELMAGRYRNALPLLDRALQANPAAPAHYLNARAYARAQTGDVEGAIGDYEMSARAGSVLSRIELAMLLWRLGRYERAADQLQTATQALLAVDALSSGRNALPWVIEMAPGQTVLLRLPAEKRCYAGWMRAAGGALAGEVPPRPVPSREDCGAEVSRIRDAVAASLGRVASGSDETGAQRARGFATVHALTLPPRQD